MVNPVIYVVSLAVSFIAALGLAMRVYQHEQPMLQNEGRAREGRAREGRAREGRANYEPYEHNNERPMCSLCLLVIRSRTTADARALSCGHLFHRDCIRNWSENSRNCPNCGLGVIQPN